MNKSSQLPPEWIDTREAKRVFGIGKTTLYHYMSTGKIRSTSLRERGKLRGKRLFSYDSIKALIEAHASGGENQGLA